METSAPSSFSFTKSIKALLSPQSTNQTGPPSPAGPGAALNATSFQRKRRAHSQPTPQPLTGLHLTLLEGRGVESGGAHLPGDERVAADRRHPQAGAHPRQAAATQRTWRGRRETRGSRDRCIVYTRASVRCCRAGEVTRTCSDGRNPES